MVHIALFSLPFLAGSIYATPFVKSDSISLMRRADGASNYTDAEILNYALTLEHLEATFYAEGMKNYSTSDFTAAGFTNDTRNAIQLLADQEATHVTALTAGLSAAGATPVSACKYSWGVSDVNGFLGLSSVLESVGVSAYLGAAPYVTNPAYLTVAAAITTVEARHQAYVAYLNGQNPFPSPFDTAQGLRQIVTLASSFITSCPDGSAPTLQTFPALALSGNATAGSYITIKAANATLNGTVFCAFASGVNPVSYAPYVSDNSSCLVPAGDLGQSYVVLTSSNSALSDNNTLAGPAILSLGGGSAVANIVDSPKATSTDIPSGTSGFGGVASSTSAGATSTKTSGAISITISGVTAFFGALAVASVM